MARKRLTKADVLRTLRAQNALLKRRSVTRIGLFGSFVRDEQKQNSDLDFLVEFDRPTYDNFVGLIGDLEQIFGRKVEVLTPDAVESIRVPEVAESIRRSVVYV
jgi:predicted nucleotidyltransferase